MQFRRIVQAVVLVLVLVLVLVPVPTQRAIKMKNILEMRVNVLMGIQETCLENV